MFFQGLLGLHNTHVVVKEHILTTSEKLKVGEVIKPGDYPSHRIRYFFRIKVIGEINAPWTKAMLDRVKLLDGKVKKESAPKKSGRPRKETKTKVKDEPKEEIKEEPEMDRGIG